MLRPWTGRKLGSSCSSRQPALGHWLRRRLAAQPASNASRQSVTRIPMRTSETTLSWASDRDQPLQTSLCRWSL